VTNARNTEYSTVSEITVQARYDYTYNMKLKTR